MKKNRIGATLLLIVAFTFAAWAGPVDEAEALKKAQAFMTERGMGQNSKQRNLRMAVKGRRPQAKSNAECDYYVFNVSNNGGFVIVSGDDRTVEILGYADSGNISETDMPDGLRYMLDGYAEQIDWLNRKGVKASAPRRAAARTAIAPLIRTRWDQGAPYNIYSPEISYQKANSEDMISGKTVTGCVATSMAQVMYYHQWPEVDCSAIPGYSENAKDSYGNAYTVTMEGTLPAITFNWGAMTLTYGNGSSDEANEAVAKLMQYCGWSLHMKYGISAQGGSSAYNNCIPEALKTYFGYDSGARGTFRSFYSYQEWIDLIYTELAARRPVVMGGQSTGGGHSFVCDGYDADDYFHINWGWAGTSDGYYRLSVLSPDEQGYGGSSTLDGFSFGQGAVIGIQKPTEGTPSYCLSLEGLYLSSDAALSSKTYTRADASSSFPEFAIHYTLCSYRFGTNYYDYALQLVDDNGNVVATLAEESNHTMKFNSDNNDNFNLSIPSTVAAGHYIIKMVSRTNGATEWQECESGERFQMEATVSETELTIAVPKPISSEPAAITLTVGDHPTLGKELEVTAHMTGGASDFRDNLFLYVNGRQMMGKQVEIPAGETVDVRFVYTPSTAGENTLIIADKSHQLATQTVNVESSDASNTPILTLTYTIDNLNENRLYGNAIRLRATVTNTSDTYNYVGKVNCSLRMYDNENDDANDYIDATVISRKVEIEKNNGSLGIPFNYNGLIPGKYYRLRFTYVHGTGDGSKETAQFELTDPYAVGGGYGIYEADGSSTLSASTTEVNAADAEFVDLRSFDSFDGVTITASSNPNCVYLLGSSTVVPASLDGKNIVKSGIASTLTLTDGHDFYTPVSFTANNVSYTRTFTRAAAGTSGWNTILLPFTVSSITCEGIGSVDWFHSGSDTGKNFWVRTFTSDGQGTVNFDFADAMTAYTPYIIAVPDDRFGAAWQMTGRAVTFSGENANIYATSDASLSGNNYKFCGSTTSSTRSDVYVLNDAGSQFAHATSDTEVPAFRAWFSAVNLTALTLPSLAIGNGQATGISLIPGEDLTPTLAEDEESYFDLSGRKLNGKPAHKGIYLFNGKKIIIR